MIRINLLAADRPKAKAASKSFEPGQKMTVLGSLIIVLTLAGIGWRFWSLQEQAKAYERDIAAAKKDEERIAELLKQVADFEARKKRIEQRVALIDELRKGQNAPVHMVDQISRSLPEMTWLTSVKQEGYVLTIEGRCLTLTSLSDFIGNLEATRYFQRPVDIVDTSVARGEAGKGPDVIQFTIRGTFQMAGIDAAPPAATKGGKRG